MSEYYNLDYKDIDSVTKLEDPLSPGAIYGSGGCFPLGTLVRTEHGLRCIDRISTGTTVLGYNKHGNVDFGKVVQVICHKVGTFEDDLYFIKAGEIELFPQGITGNHAIYDKTTNEHKEVKEFCVGDTVCGLNSEYEITEITITTNEHIETNVYNLIVEPQHTYFVGSYEHPIKVHNGGGGKGGGTPAPAIEKKNTVQSDSIAHVLEVISHGEIVGVVGGMKGVYYNNTVVQNPDGSMNFEGVSVGMRNGTPSQELLPAFVSVKSEVILAGTVITQAGVTEQLPNSNVDAANITILFPEGLFKYNLENGDLNGYEVNFSIYKKARNATTWTLVANVEIKDKVTGPWEIDYRIEKPQGANQWDIRLVRNSAEDTKTSHQSEIVWARLTEITYDQLTYNGIALAGHRVPASSVGGQVPTRAYLVRGLKVRVPINYGPTTRTYGSSYWNGAFKTAWTDNTAWCLLDLITNKESGLQNYLGQNLDIDIFAFYEASLYNDCATWTGSGYTYNLIDDGEGGQEVRFTFNNVIQTQLEAWQLIQAVASNMHAIVVDRGGQISLIQDRPQVVTKFFNNSNVLEGLFTYSTSEGQRVHTAVNCTFNNKNDRYLPDTVSEQDNPGIAKYGFTPKDIIAYGVVTASAARREARYHLFTEINQGEFVAFGLGLNVLDIEVGQIVKIMDNDYISDSGILLAGRIKSVGGGNTVVLDSQIDIIAGYTFTIAIMLPDRSDFVTRTIISGPGKTDTITMSSGLPAGTYVDQEFFCYSAGFIEPREFKILSITEQEPGKYSVNALLHYPTKYSVVESGLVITPVDPPTALATVIPPPTNIQFLEHFVNTGVISDNYILVTWRWNEDRALQETATFRFRWRKDNGVYQVITDITRQEFRIPSVVPGIYEVIIEAETLTGKRSLPATSTYNYRTAGALSTLEPPVQFYVTGTSTTTFSGRQLSVSWNYNGNNENKSDVLLDYRLEIWSSGGVSKLNTFFIKPNAVKGGSFLYSYEQNFEDFGVPSRTIQIKLYSRDTVGDISLPLVRTFSNPVPPQINIEVLSGTEASYITLTNAGTDSDFAGYIIHRSLTPGFTPDLSNVVYDGTDSVAVVKGEASKTYYFRAAAYDLFGKVGLNYTSQISSTLLSTDPFIWVYTGLLFKPNDPTTNKVSWTAGTASVNAAAPITIDAGNLTWSSGVLYIYYNGTSNTLSGTTSLAVAISGATILATYKGGTDLTVGNGRAFSDGSLLLAGTVGANQLVANSAIITTTAQIANQIVGTQHVQDGAITNLKIGNTLESTNFSETSFLGWRFDKTGPIKSYNSFELYDSSGKPVIVTGEKAEITWNNIGGLGRPQNHATVGGEFASTRVFEPIAQTELVPINGHVNAIRKNINTTAWDNHAYTSQTIVGNGACRFRFLRHGSTNLACVGGLSVNPTTSVGNGNINFGFYRTTANDVIILEGANIGILNTGPLNDTDEFEIEYESDGSIIYKINGTAVRTTSTSTGVTFHFKCAFFNAFSQINGISFGTYNPTFTPQYITFIKSTDVVGPASITKSNGAEGVWDGGAYSLQSVTIGMSVKFHLPYANTEIIAGISEDPTLDSGFNSINYGFYVFTDGNIYMYELGVNRGVAEPHVTNGLYEIEYTQLGEIIYRRGTTIFRTVTSVPGRTFYFDSSINKLNGSIYGISIGTVAGQGNLSGKITPSNVTTYIATAAIGNAQIANASIDTAQIRSAAVETLTIQGNAVTVPASAFISASTAVAVNTGVKNLITLNLGVISTTETTKVVVIPQVSVVASAIDLTNTPIPNVFWYIYRGETRVFTMSQGGFFNSAPLPNAVIVDVNPNVQAQISLRCEVTGGTNNTTIYSFYNKGLFIMAVRR